MNNEERMAQIIAEKDHIIGSLISVIEDYRSRLIETEEELKHAETMQHIWWEHYRDLKNELELGGGDDE